MSYINLTPHSIDVYPEEAFENLTQLNATTWVADSVDEDQAIVNIKSQGCARISTTTIPVEFGPMGIPMFATVYGGATGMPTDVSADDIIIVSLPMLSMLKSSNHPLADRCVTPYKVVRDADNTSNVLGCIGFTE